MADLSQIDLDGGSEPAVGGSEEIDSLSSESVEYIPSKPKKKGLDLYYSQKLSHKTGVMGILILVGLSIILSLTFLLLAFSYTPKGITFLRGLEIRIFW